MQKVVKIFVNLLTLSRIFFSIALIFIGNVLSSFEFLIFVALFFLTDQIDGFFARKYRVQTLFGAIMDTLADKILCITLLTFLIEVGDKVKFGLLLLIGEILILLINTVATFLGRKTMVSMTGKIKMWLLSVSIVIGYLVKFNYIDISLFSISSSITFVVQLFVAISYFKYIIGQKTVKKVNDFKLDIKNLFNTDYYLKNYS